MENEIEKIVGDISNIDTARMSLRWALEKISSLEKEKLDLKKNVEILDDEKKKLSERLSQIEFNLNSRLKTVEEKEDFYKKLEATISLLGEGKISIDDLIKKEARIEILRKELEEEYQKRFEELDIKQRNLVGLWQKRLLDTESLYSEKLSEAQKKYDQLKKETEEVFKNRINEIEDSFRLRETELLSRVKNLEENLAGKERALEEEKEKSRREYEEKKKELEERGRKEYEFLTHNFNKKLENIEEERKREISEIHKAFEAERERVVLRAKEMEEKYKESQTTISKLENEIS
ncbi:MAG: hypothetical protein N2Z60_09440, partial [Elusimicrobiales bacterium]|nr:hypothetical protein [Elusimicrobiales bacterium]